MHHEGACATLNVQCTNNMSKPSPPPKPSDLLFATALYNYQAADPAELSFESGDLLYVIQKTDENWWKARLRGKEGYVPSNHLELKEVKGLTPLHDACRRGNLKLLEECIMNRIPININDKAGNTPLHYVSHAGNVQCFERIFQLVDPRVVLVNQKNRMGDTALHLAAAKGQAEIIRRLRDLKVCEVDITLKNNEGKTALEVAKDAEVKAELLKWNASVGVGTKTSGYSGDDYAEISDEE